MGIGVVAHPVPGIDDDSHELGSGGHVLTDTKNVALTPTSASVALTCGVYIAFGPSSKVSP